MKIIMIGKTGVLLDQYEYQIVNYMCQIGKGRQFCAAEIGAALSSAVKKKIGTYTAESLLNRLVRKKVMKKKYVRNGLFRWSTLYYVPYDAAYFNKHTRRPDFSTDAEWKAWRREVRRIRFQNWHMRYVLGVITEPIETVYVEDPEEMTKLADRFLNH